jgi:hypothetical protein
MVFNFSNGKEYEAEFNVDLSFTKFKDGNVRYKKILGIK